MAKKLKTAAPADQPYYLQRAHIKDFRSIRDAVVEFKPGLNIIIGPNGSGKTNFVRGVENTLTKPKYDFNGKTELKFIGEDILQVEAKTINNYNDDIFNAMGLTHNINQHTIILTAQNLVFQEDSFQKAQYKLLTHKRDSGKKFTVLKLITLAHGIPEEYSIVKKPVDFRTGPDGGNYSISYDSLFADSLAANISSALLRAHNSLQEEDIDSIHEYITLSLDQVENAYLERLLPSIKAVTSINNIRFTGRFNIYNESINHQTLIQGFKLEFKIDNDWLPFSSLSSGTQRMFYLISEITASSLYFSILKGKLDDTSAVIIQLEEPELGIHPDQLEKLLIFLREQSKKHQIIITTHSPQVLGMLNDNELDRITICELDPKKGTQFRKLKKSQIATAKRYMSTQGLYLSDYWLYGSLESND